MQVITADFGRRILMALLAELKVRFQRIQRGLLAI
jgi:hypothetical protein